MVEALLLGCVLVFVQVCVIPGQDASDVARFVVGFVGLLGLIWLAMRKKLNGVGYLMVVMPFLYTVGVSCQRYIPGYTEYHIIWCLAGGGVMLLASRANVRVIMGALVAGILIQATIQHFDLIPWADVWPDAKDSVWGTFRHRIRYSTWMMAGLVGVWYLWRTKKWYSPLLLIIGCVALFEISRAQSEMIQVLSAVLLSVFVGKALRWQYGVALIAVCVSVAGVSGIGGYNVHNLLTLNGRLAMWVDVTCGMFSTIWQGILGHGAGAWWLDCGSLGWQTLRHPHNDLLHIGYMFGTVGMWWTICMVAFAVICARGLPLKLGIIAIALSMCTNSAYTYPEQYLLVNILIGLGLHDLTGDPDERKIIVDSEEWNSLICNYGSAVLV